VMGRTCHSPENSKKVIWKSSSSGGGLFTERLMAHLEPGAFLVRCDIRTKRNAGINCGRRSTSVLTRWREDCFVARKLLLRRRLPTRAAARPAARA
jgi:hypothetical protein